MRYPGVGHGTGNFDAGGKEVRGLVALFAAALAFALGAGGAGAQEKPPAGYGSIDSYPVPIGVGAADELDFCYRYSKRVWELVRGQPKDKATLDKLTAVAKQALGSKGAAEDTAELKKYFSGGPFVGQYERRHCGGEKSHGRRSMGPVGRRTPLLPPAPGWRGR